MTMERKKASDFPPEVLKLFDGYVHGTLSRRDFLERAARYAIGGFTAAAMLESLKPNFAWAQQVPKDDARIRAEYVEYPSPQGSGTMHQMAVRIPDLAAAVPFYGSQAAASDVPKIKAPLLIHYASDDERINKGWPAFEEALKANKARYAMHMYPNTQHGFHNDTPPRYDEAAAKLAWQRTVDFFNKHLRS